MTIRNIDDIRKHHGEEAARRAREREAANAPALGDRYGRRVGVGDRVHLHLALDVLCEVLEVNRVLDPRAPAGQLTITLGMTLTQFYAEGQTVPAMTLIWSRAELDAMEAEARRLGLRPEDASTREKPPAAPGTVRPEGETPAGSGIVITDLGDGPAVEPPGPPKTPAAPPTESGDPDGV